MGRVDNSGSGGDLIKLVDEDGTFFRQVSDDVAVMDNFLADVDRCAERFQRNLHDIDGPDYSGAEATGLQEQHLFHGLQGSHAAGRWEGRE